MGWNEMRYLSCRAESSILTSDSPISTSTSRKSVKVKKSNKEEEEEDVKSAVKIQEFLYRELEVATHGFSQEKLLGRGSHGCVYKGVLSNGRLVAVKKPSGSSMRHHRHHQNVLSPSGENMNTQQVENEIHILSKIRSPGLVNLVGFSTGGGGEQRLLVVEFMNNGTLYDILHSTTGSSNRSSSSSRRRRLGPPNWGLRIRLCLQTAKAIHTLHSLDPPVIHRDIKSANVLIDSNFNARLGDFGLALESHVYGNFRTPPAGTIGYLDPAYITPDNLSTKTDVFSFGILLLEIISGRKAIDIAHSPPSILDWAVPHIRKGNFLVIYDPRIPPPRDPFATKQLAVLAAKCVRSCKERRPTMKHVVDCLSYLTNIIPSTSISSSSSWNINPCMMMDQVVGATHHQVIRSRSSSSSSDMLRNSRRVYSDLGVRKKNNLMDLMTDDQQIHPHPPLFKLRRNPSMGY